MKRNLLLLLAIASTILTANAQWELQTNPLGYGNSAMIGKIQFVSATEGWISASKSGKLLHTTNSGDTWSIVDPFPEITAGSLSDPGLTMSWPTATHGFALKSKINGTGGDFMSICDGAVLYKTTNGGTNWTKQDFPKSITTTVYSNNDLTGTWQVHALLTRNTSNPSSVSNWLQGTAIVDTNGGCTLSLINSGGGQNTRNIDMTVNSRGKLMVENKEVGFLSADKNTLIITTDEEFNACAMYILQKQQTSTTYALADLQGSWNMHALSAGNSSGDHSGWGHAVLTCDATGVTSSNYTDAENSGTYQSTLTIDANGMVGGMSDMATAFHGYMSADKNTIYATMTGKSNTDYNLVAFQRIQTETSYSMADLKGLWQAQSLVSDKLNDTYSNNNNYWSNWSRSQTIINSQGGVSISNLVVNDESRDDMRTGMAIGSTGLVTFDEINNCDGFLSADKNLMIFTMPDIGSGGYTFGVLQRDLSISGDIGFQVQFADENTGWVSNYNPIYETFNIYKTTNGASNWDLVPANAGGIYQFLDANNGWMIGSSSESVGENSINTIFHSTDGGTTWQRKINLTSQANAIHFSDAMNGWIVGKAGLLIKTSNGGNNWDTLSITGFNSNTNYKTVFFLDANHGWIGGGDEDTEGVGTRFVLATKNGGTSWTTQPTPVTNSLFSISAWDTNHVWFTSDYGQIAHYIAPKTLSISAGGLNAALTPTEKETLQNLVVTGTMDARDFKVLRDQLPALVYLDLSDATVVAYGGTEGTVKGNYSYPDNTTPRNAMLDNTQIQHIALPNNLISIGRSSFNGCSALWDVQLPTSLQLIDSLAFCACSNLKYISLTQNIKRLAYGAFAWSGIEHIRLNEGMTRIDDIVFQQCDSLQDIYIPSTMNSISPYALFNLNSLSYINVGYNPVYQSENGVLFSKDKTHLVAYPANKSSHYDIPYSVTTIDTAAFAGNWKLISVTIPTSVSEIAPDAFSYCSQLAVIDLPYTISKIGEYSFSNCTGLAAIFTDNETPFSMAVSDSIFFRLNPGCTLYIPKGSAAAYKGSEGWSHYLSRIKEYEKVTDVDDNVYHGIQIGTQTWLVENLRTTRYNNYYPISNTPEPNMDLTNWPTANFGWTLYDAPANSYVYGRLYTWNAATDQRGICPSGWKIPSMTEWQTLIDYVSSHNSTSTTKALAAPSLWYEDPEASENMPANTCWTNNESGFLAFPAGIRQASGSFMGNWESAFMWSDENSGNYHEAYYFNNTTTEVEHSSHLAQQGFSVRCIKDNSVSLENMQADRVAIAPNPVSTDFSINGLQETATITVVNMNGQVMISKTTSTGQPISVADLADGMYLVTIKTNKMVKTKPLIVRHGR